MIILKSERLYLRQYRKEDIDPLHFIFSETIISNNEGEGFGRLDKDNAQKFQNN